MNKRYIFSLCLMLFAAVCMTSCLKDDDSSSISYYDDTAITSFTLTTVNTYTTTTSSDGTTKTTKSTLSTKPVFVIDQYNYKIYNPVALPSNCDLQHVLATITAKNSGTVVLKSLTSDSLYVYSSTDSVDFSKPREIRVYANDGSGYRTYDVTFNVEKPSSESITWTAMEAGTAEAPEALYREVAVEKGENGFQLSLDNGATWSSELLGDGEDASFLPKEQIGYVKMLYTASVNAEYELMAGLVSADDAYCTVWRKIVENGASAPVAKWVYIPDTDNKSLLPNLGGVSLVRFNNQTYAIGAGGTIYKTRDWGLTWKESDDISLPVSGSITIKAATDAFGNLWIRNTGDGSIWKGVLTK